MAERTSRLGSVNTLERSLILVTAVMVVAGVICVASAATPQVIANGGSIWGFLARDLVYVAVGTLGFIIACRFPPNKMARFAAPMLALSVGLLIVVPMVGTSTSGGRRWLSFGGLSVQPSELFTLAACFFLAFYIAKVERSSRDWLDLLKLALPIVVGAGLIFLEPDMGTASVVLIVALGVFVMAGMPRRLIVSTVGTGVVAALVFAYSSPYRRARLLSFLHPGSDPGGAGYQVLQAKIGLGAGRVSGLGLGHGRLPWGLLPNPHTDFIFAVVGEEFGFIGSVVILGLFIWLITLGARTAGRAPDRESQLLAAGITLWFGVEVLINVASVVGWWPVTGIPLPMISYGGTSLIIDLVALGLLVNVARRIGVRSQRSSTTTVATLRPRTAAVTATAQRRVAQAAPMARERRRRV